MTRLPARKSSTTLASLSGNAVRTLAMILFCLPLIAVPPASADSLKRGQGGQNMKYQYDVTGGMRYLLANDDLITLQVTVQNGEVTTELVTQDTSNSGFSGQPQTITVSQINPNGQFNTAGAPAAQAAARMFETAGDILAVLNEGNGPTWQLMLLDPLTHFVYQTPISSRLRPYGTVFTQLATGDFLGNNLDDLLVFYLSLNFQQVEWGMKVLTAPQPPNEGTPVQGPEFYGNGQPVPVTGSIVTGDFDGDGRDEIALLLTDYQTIVFYAVDPATLAISQIGSIQLNSPFVPGQVALATGHFRTSVSNAELVAFGQLSTGSNGYTVVSIGITPKPNGMLKAAELQTYQFPNKHHSSAALAQAASILNWPQTSPQQIVLGTQVTALGYESYIDIGSFDNGFNYQPDSETHLTQNDYDSLQSMRVGNFDNCYLPTGPCPEGKHDPALEIETLTYEGLFLPVPVIRIWEIHPPNPLHFGDWLTPYSQTTAGLTLGATLLDTVPGDIQGRSLRLGEPTILRIPTQIQPDTVLGIPPMHIDWVNPITTQLDSNEHPGCVVNGQAQRCVFNLTVLPSLPAPAIGFSTAFNFSSSSNSETKRSDTTSWGISVKQTEGTSVSWGNALAGGSASIQDSTMYAHDHNVAKTYDQFQSQTDSISSTTGFADHIFYTEKTENVYYYPVLGSSSCPSNDPNCMTKYPTYVEFSVPDSITHADVDATNLDWYQPVHEPGNILSYPWTAMQLNNQFSNGTNTLSTPICQATDTSQEQLTSTWTAGNGNETSTGTSNSFSNDLSFSYSERAGVQDVGGGSFNYSVDIGVSTSLSTLNVDSSTLSASTGAVQYKPAFDSDIADCCAYTYTGYILGQGSGSNPAYQTLSLSDPQGNPVDFATTGPMFVEYLSDVQNQSCQGGFPSWWTQVYSLPDVAVNHPERWQWNKSTQTATFNEADTSGTTPAIDQAFYHMKSFFISKCSQEPCTVPEPGPNLASAISGDDLTLTVRVYNYSLVDTDDPSLQHPAASIRVSFYGQVYCENTGNVCGNAFRIGQTQIDKIPGFESSSGNPNWTTASVDFNTANYPQLSSNYMVFWVVVWMEDSNGNLVPEMPDHGLTADPRNLNLQQITQVPIEPYSNNVGMYPVHSPFFVAPSSPGLERTPTASYLQSIALSADQRELREQRTKLTAQLRSAGPPAHSVTIAYYDGDPAKNGRLLDVQHIPYMAPNVTYTRKTFFQPESCGIHQLYTSAWLPYSSSIAATAPTVVYIEPVNDVNTLIASTKGAPFRSGVTLTQLLQLLDSALQDFQQDQAQAGADEIGAYINAVQAALGKVIDIDNGNRLIGAAEALLQCVPRPSIQPKPNTAS